MRTVPQRELRNDIARVLREVGSGETVQVTVRGRVVAELGPPRRRELTDRATALRVVGTVADETWLADLRESRTAAERAERDAWS